MHQYRIQYQKFLNTWTLSEVVAHSDLKLSDFVAYLAKNGYPLDGTTWLAPGCIQQVVVIS